MSDVFVLKHKTEVIGCIYGNLHIHTYMGQSPKSRSYETQNQVCRGGPGSIWDVLLCCISVVRHGTLDHCIEFMTPRKGPIAQMG